MHPDDLQSVELDFLVIHHAHAGFRDGFQILAAARELLMITGYEKRAVGHRECATRVQPTRRHRPSYRRTCRRR